MNGFNGKEAAISAGYSAKTAEQQASRLLRNVKVLEFIDEEMKLLSKRMRDDANRIYRLLWDRIYDCGVKLANSEKAKKSLIPLNDEISRLQLLDIPFAEHIDNLHEELDDMKGDRGEDEQIRRAEIEMELAEYNNSRRALKAKIKYIGSLKANLYLSLLDNQEYEKFARLQTDLLQDLFDRSGYKETKDLQDRRVALLDAQINKLNADEQDERPAKLNQIIASTENIQARTELIKGAKKDTSIMEALIDVVNGGDGSGEVSVQSKAARDDQTENK